MNKGQSDICGQHGLVLVVDARDHAVEDEGGAVPLHALGLEVGRGLRLEGIDVGCLVKLS